MSEILGTLFKYLLALLAITAVVAVLYEALSSNKVSTAVSQITTMQANISQLYSGTSLPSSSTDITANLINANDVPASMVSGTALTNPWGGAVTASISSTIGSDADIVYAGVPQAACVKLATAILPSTAQIGFAAAAGTTATTTVIPSDTAAVTDINTACKTGGSSNTLIFTFPVS